jgi:hypothetical protein
MCALLHGTFLCSKTEVLLKYSEVCKFNFLSLLVIVLWSDNFYLVMWKICYPSFLSPSHIRWKTGKIFLIVNMLSVALEEQWNISFTPSLFSDGLSLLSFS